jgi:hypothetical protein
LINIANPINPYEVGFYETPSSTHNVAVAGSHMFMAAYHSGIQIYENLLTGVQETEPSHLQQGIRLMQNPVVHDRIHIRLNIPSQSDIRIEVCNVLGQIVQEQPVAVYPVGIHELSIPVHHLPAGVYFLTVRGLADNARIKVIIAR